MNLQDMCERIVRDAIPATDSGATCFVPRYQIDQLREALSAPQPPAEAQAQGGGESWPMTEAEVHQWIGACNHEPARQVLRDYLQLRTAPPSAPVGVEGIIATDEAAWALAARAEAAGAERDSDDNGTWWTLRIEHFKALAQKPAAAQAAEIEALGGGRE